MSLERLLIRGSRLRLTGTTTGRLFIGICDRLGRIARVRDPTRRILKINTFGQGDGLLFQIYLHQIGIAGQRLQRAADLPGTALTGRP